MAQWLQKLTSSRIIQLDQFSLTTWTPTNLLTELICVRTLAMIVNKNKLKKICWLWLYKVVSASSCKRRNNGRENEYLGLLHFDKSEVQYITYIYLLYCTNNINALHLCCNIKINYLPYIVYRVSLTYYLCYLPSRFIMT